MSTSIAWIAVDWGTSTLRAWAMSATHRVIDQRRSDQGMGKLLSTQFEAALLVLIDDWLVDSHRKIPVIACGMVGAKQGWIEAKYRSTPVDLTTASHLSAAAVTGMRFSVNILSGISQSSPPDVMRGEETQIAGWLAQHDAYTGLICLPGTHTKWVNVEKGIVVGFTTYMSGELFALLSEQSVIRHSLDANAVAVDESLFSDALIETKSGDLVQQLFSLRAASLLQDVSANVTKARLSAILLGHEVASASQALNQTSPVIIIGMDRLTRLYQLAITQLTSNSAKCIDADQMTLAGLSHAYEAFKQEQPE